MRRVAMVMLVVTAVACAGPPDARSDGAAPSKTPRAKPPRVARFETGFTILTVTGVSCDGLRGPWRVLVVAPEPIEGRDRATFRLPNGKGPGRLRWSFQAQHPGHGVATYEGNVRVRAFRTEDGTVLRFSGDQTSVGVTAPIVGDARVRFGGGCPG